MTIVIRAASLQQRQTAVTLVERILINRILSRNDAVNSFTTVYIIRLSATIVELHELASALDDKQIAYD